MSAKRTSPRPIAPENLKAAKKLIRKLPSSPDASQRKVWKAEIADFQRAKKKVLRDFETERRRLENEIKIANRNFSKFTKTKDKKVWPLIEDYDRRIAILQKRMGL